MKTVDNLKDLEKFIIDSYGSDETKRRHPDQDLRQYLLNLQRENGPMSHCDPITINELVDIYLHARFNPEPDFGPEHYHRYHVLMERIKEQIIPKISETTSERTSPTKVVQRKGIGKGLTTNLSFKNLTNLSSSSSLSTTMMAKDNNIGAGNVNKKTDETCV